MQTQYNVVSYRIDLYSRDYKLALEIDENGHSDSNIDNEKRQKVIEQERGCKFIRINCDEEGYNNLELSINYLDILNNQLKKNFNKQNFNEIITIRI